MRFIKFLGFCAFGYFAYQLWEAVCRESHGRLQNSESRNLRRALNEDAGRMDPRDSARGVDVVTEDSDGAQSHYRVGRGVVFVR
jgi:hypothetical protein